MKKLLPFFLILLFTGCTKKADIICTTKTDLFTTEVGLYFKENTLKEAYSISTY